jgi:hypothetical protein
VGPPRPGSTEEEAIAALGAEASTGRRGNADCREETTMVVVRRRGAREGGGGGEEEERRM